MEDDWEHEHSPRYFQGMALLRSGQVLVAGGDICWGYSGGASPGDSAELYNPSTGTWKTTTSMNANLVSPMTPLQDGRALMGNELYTPSTAQWTLTSNMREPYHTSLAAVLLANGNVLIYGDQSACYAGEFYNPVIGNVLKTIAATSVAISIATEILRRKGPLPPPMSLSNLRGTISTMSTPCNP